MRLLFHQTKHHRWPASMRSQSPRRRSRFRASPCREERGPFCQPPRPLPERQGMRRGLGQNTRPRPVRPERCRKGLQQETRPDRMRSEPAKPLPPPLVQGCGLPMMSDWPWVARFLMRQCSSFITFLVEGGSRHPPRRFAGRAIEAASFARIDPVVATQQALEQARDGRQAGRGRHAATHKPVNKSAASSRLAVRRAGSSRSRPSPFSQA